MEYFLGFFVNDQSRKQITDTVSNTSPIFSDMGIEVRWIKPSHYHMKIQNIPGSMNFLKKLYISKRIKGVFNKSIQISIGNLRLGSARNLKGLIYIEIGEGGDALRELRYEMLKTLKIKDNVQFVPHIAVGRINKELSNQEFSNIVKDIRNVNRNVQRDMVAFEVRELDLIRIKEGSYEILKKFKTAL